MKTNLIKTELTLAQIKYLNGLFTIIVPFTC